MTVGALESGAFESERREMRVMSVGAAISRGGERWKHAVSGPVFVSLSEVIPKVRYTTKEVSL